MPSSSCHGLWQVKNYTEGEVVSLPRAVEHAETKILEYNALQGGWEEHNSS